MNKGLVHVYCGDGKGKTTAAMGLLIRAAGVGKQCVLVQFMKDTPSGELESLKKLGIPVLRGKQGSAFFSEMTEEEKQNTVKGHNQALKKAFELACEGKCDLLVLDEACSALRYGMLDEALLKQALYEKPEGLELVLTGRDPADFILERADYVTEMCKRKHPYDAGILARKGIEF